MSNHNERLSKLGRARWVVATILTVLIVIIYFSFILLVAYAKELLGREIVPGLSVGILMGAGVILASWLLTFIYVQWANRVYDIGLQKIREEEK
mgnify:CR=1 FL=1